MVMVSAVTVPLTVPGRLAAQERFEVQTVDTTGCNSGDFGMTVLRSNLDGGTYTVRTLVNVGASVFMNEAASISVNGTSSWNVFNNFTYGPVGNQGTYPIPAGQQMQLDFTLERPIGTILFAWRLIVDGCDTGNILLNGPTAVVQIPTLAPYGMTVLTLSLAAAAFMAFRRRNRRARGSLF